MYQITLQRKFFSVVTLMVGLSALPAFANDFVVIEGAWEAAGKVPGPGAPGIPGTPGAPGAPGTPPTPGVSASISWDELKDRCLHPEQFDVQRPPQNIKLQCSDTRFEFVPSSSGQIALAGSRSVVSSVLSDKFHVVAGAAEVPVQGKPGSCLRYKEVEKLLTIEKPMSCNEILGIKGDLSEFCASALDRARGTNPKLPQARDTGRILDTCTAAISGGGSQSGGAGSGAGDSHPVPPSGGR